jgi:hypothetical protein
VRPGAEARPWPVPAFSAGQQQGFTAVRTVERPHGHTVLIALARQGTDVRRHRALPVLGRAWGRARRGRADHAGRSPRSGHLVPENAISFACPILAPPAGFGPAHTAPECTPAYSRYQQERHLAVCVACMDARIVVLSFATCRHCANDPGPRSLSARDCTMAAKGAACSGWSTLMMPRVGCLAA